MKTLTVHNVVLSERDFRRSRDIVYKHCGINLHAGKKELVRARLAKRLRLGNFKTFPEYIDHLFNDESGKEFSTMIDSISTNLTGFFREQPHFDFLKNTFLPLLLEKKRNKRNFKIRAWSAGCSTGEEAYSMAITLNQAIAGKGQWDIKILASDISASVLETAKRGLYDTEKIEPVPLQQMKKYLVPHQKNNQKIFEANKILKDTVIFRYLNLMENWPITGPVDIIFCRNVMIYFDKPTQSRLISRFWDLLDSGGVLFTGHSESLTGIEHKFKYVQPTIYIKP